MFQTLIGYYAMVFMVHIREQAVSGVTTIPPCIERNDCSYLDCSTVNRQSYECKDGICVCLNLTADGVWTSWESWSSCDTSCGPGTTNRNRQCFFPTDQRHGDYCHGLIREVADCKNTPCPVDGVLGQWNAWYACSVSCGGGKRARDRTCDYPDGVDHGANCTGTLHEIEDCSTEACPVDGVWLSWEAWSSCTTSCGPGTRRRRRDCFFQSHVPQGDYCAGPSRETENCTNPLCSVDGTLTEWSAWSICPVTCGGGRQSRYRNCTYDPPEATHGTACTDPLTDSQDCNADLCPVDGFWGDWSSWSECSQTCNLGTRHRSRQCTYNDTVPHGAPCPASDPDSENDFCTLEYCPVDGIWSQWTGWGLCSATCGNGTVTRTRDCGYTIPLAPRGKNCSGSDAESKPCDNVTDCAVDGQWSEWSAWGGCTATCGHADQYRTRTCEFPPDRPAGHPCGGLSNQTQACTVDACPVDGVWLSWEAWSSCTTSCGPGTRRRWRDCFFQSHVPQGEFCPGTSRETENCTNPLCAVDGLLTEWSAWSVCPVTCGGGRQSRDRNCTYDPPEAPQGAPCTDPLTDSRDCNGDPCPVTPLTMRSCHKCVGPPEMCEAIHASQQCDSLEQQYCINEVDNRDSADRTVVRRCGTLQECHDGWYQKFSTYSRCLTFDEQFIYTHAFYCEFCCTTDNCNSVLNMPEKYHP